MKILYVVKNMRLANGVSSYAMNYYRELVIDKDIQIDFLIVSDVGSPYYDEIKTHGSHIYIMPSYSKHFFSSIKYISQVLKNGNYDIVHSHVLNSGSIILKLSKKYRIPVRIIHSHATKSGDLKLKELRNKLFIKISLANANSYFACSKLAGDYLFKNRKYTVINNAIDLDKFGFNMKYRTSIRDELGINNKLIIIAVGRFTRQKNPFFIVDIVKSLSQKNNNFELLWLGNGVLEDDVKEYAQKKCVSSFIRFLGANDRVNEFYSAADVFILPSLFEGLPVVGIEAQISGLPCIFSSEITREVKISEACEFISIDSPDLWSKKIIELGNTDREKNIDTIKKDSYNIKKQSEILKNIYNKLYEEKKK